MNAAGEQLGSGLLTSLGIVGSISSAPRDHGRSAGLPTNATKSAGHDASVGTVRRRRVRDARDRQADTFRALFDDHHLAVLGYALRRTAGAQDAADVLADTMLVAWRRLDEVPGGDTTRLWLYGVARKVL